MLEACLAKALYDNIPETPEELSFRRGDVITVIEQDTNGLEGWWLCSLKGRQGIAPGNRLKLITGMQEPPRNSSINDNASQLSPSRWNRRSMNIEPDKVITPQKVGDVYRYDQVDDTNTDYDVPPTRYLPVSEQKSSIARKSDQHFLNDSQSSARSSKISLDDQSVYDVPLSQRSSLSYESYDPSSNRSSSISMMSAGSTLSSSTSNMSFQSPSARSSSEIAPHDTYNIPQLHNQDNSYLSQYRGSGTLAAIPGTPTKNLDGYDTPTVPVDSDIYDTPPSIGLNYSEIYDYPKSQDRPVENAMKSTRISDEGVYDLPSDGTSDKLPFSRTSQHDAQDIYDVPSNNALLGHHRSSRGSVNDPNGVYDIPPEVSRDTNALRKSDSQASMENVDLRLKRLSSSSLDSRGSDLPVIPWEELPYDLDAAMEILVKCQQDVHNSTSHLLGYVNSTWRSKENLEKNLHGIKLACDSVRTSVQRFCEFGQGALANSARVADRNLVHKLDKSLQPIQACSQSMIECMKLLESVNWQVSELAQKQFANNDNDPLGQIITNCKEIPNDMRTLAAIIQGNSTLLFRRSQLDSKAPSPAQKQGVVFRQRERASTPEKRNSVQDRPLPPPPTTSGKQSDSLQSSQGKKPPLPPGKKERRSSKEALADDDNDYENDSREWVDEYDYVQLQSKPNVPDKKKNSISSPANKPGMGMERDRTPERSQASQKADGHINSSVINVTSNKQLVSSTSGLNSIGLIPSDKQLLVYYSGQLVTHSNALSGAIDSFLRCIECSQPPKAYVAHSKFVVLNAHKMVYIGDTLHRNIIHNEVRSKIMHCANYLCETLKQVVTATKTAALQYPSVVAVQDMVDRIVDASHAAHELKLVITQSAML